MIKLRLYIISIVYSIFVRSFLLEKSIFKESIINIFFGLKAKLGNDLFGWVC